VATAEEDRLNISRNTTFVGAGIRHARGTHCRQRRADVARRIKGRTARALAVRPFLFSRRTNSVQEDEAAYRCGQR